MLKQKSWHEVAKKFDRDTLGGAILLKRKFGTLAGGLGMDFPGNLVQIGVAAVIVLPVMSKLRKYVAVAPRTGDCK